MKHDLFVVEDRIARFFFARTTGALCGIVSKINGKDLTPFRRPQPLFAIRLAPHEKTISQNWLTLTSFDARCLAAGTPEPKAPHARRFVYELNLEDGTVAVTLTCTPTADGELTWTMEVGNHLQAGCRLYLYNMNTPATVWFDDIRLVPEE